MPITYQFIIGGLALACAAVLFFALRASRAAYANGYNSGHDDASRACELRIEDQQVHIRALQADLGAMQAKHINDRAALLLQADQVLDRNNARNQYAQFQPGDVDTLTSSAKLLRLAGDVFARLHANDKAEEAHAAQDAIRALLQRIPAALATEVPPPLDTKLFDFLEQHATGSADFGTFTLSFEVGDTFRGTRTIREAVTYALVKAEGSEAPAANLPHAKSTDGLSAWEAVDLDYSGDTAPMCM
ncbi:hypothetical protein ACL8FW_14265 [Pseudomonas aeruginosa]|uniref:hypothetical protein n=1 Tax=Pseudomonas aeruginosa TaxID=287 RepID=UPI003ABFA96A